MSNNLARPSSPNLTEYKTYKTAHSLGKVERDPETASNNQLDFIKKSQWMLLLISNAICLTFVAFSCMLVN